MVSRDVLNSVSLSCTIFGVVSATFITGAWAGDGNPVLTAPKSSYQPTVIDGGLTAPNPMESTLPTITPAVPIDQLQQPAVAVERPAVAAPSVNRSWDTNRR